MNVYLNMWIGAIARIPIAQCQLIRFKLMDFHFYLFFPD